MSGITEICFACGRPVLEDCVRGRQAEPYHRACTLAPSRAVYRAALEETAELDVDGSEYGSPDFQAGCKAYRTAIRALMEKEQRT